MEKLVLCVNQDVKWQVRELHLDDKEEVSNAVFFEHISCNGM